MRELTICCADIGSVANDNFGWAALAGESDRERFGRDMRKFAAFVAEHLRSDGKVSMGFECPLWIPIADEPAGLTKARQGERNRPFAAAAGACSLTTGLAQVAWILEQIRQDAKDTKAFLCWRCFQRSPSGLFIWEAFVTGKSKASPHEEPSPHESDALAACNAFSRALPYPVSVLEPSSRTRSLVGAALLWADWSTDVRLLHTPCLVIQP